MEGLLVVSDAKTDGKIFALSGDCLNSHSLKPCQSPVMS